MTTNPLHVAFQIRFSDQLTTHGTCHGNVKSGKVIPIRLRVQGFFSDGAIGEGTVNPKPLFVLRRVKPALWACIERGLFQTNMPNVFGFEMTEPFSLLHDHGAVWIGAKH